VRVTDCRDPKDDKYLELPLAAGAETLVSSDDDLPYFRQLVVGKIGETVQTQWHEHGSSGGGEAPSG
jgi:predicted nucleic acid-binding protein